MARDATTGRDRGVRVALRGVQGSSEEELRPKGATGHDRGDRRRDEGVPSVPPEEQGERERPEIVPPGRRGWGRRSDCRRRSRRRKQLEEEVQAEEEKGLHARAPCDALSTSKSRGEGGRGHPTERVEKQCSEQRD
ncbi:hypothetical protein ON010_g12569 [Phytophthora cinnamomi]|nr:hypothetical protein ON010_g12569 [Phytophthora cinnamomi]